MLSLSTEVIFMMSSFFLVALSGADDSGILCKSKFSSLFSLSFCSLNSEVVSEATDSVEAGLLVMEIGWASFGSTFSFEDFARDA